MHFRGFFCTFRCPPAAKGGVLGSVPRTQPPCTGCGLGAPARLRSQYRRYFHVLMREAQKNVILEAE